MSKKKFADGTQNHTLGTVIIILVMVAVVSLMLFWMYSAKLLLLPEPIAKLFGISNTANGEMPWDLGELSEIVRDERHPDLEVLTLEMTWENLKSALLLEEGQEGVYIYGRVCYFDDGKEVGHRVVYRRDGEKFRADIYQSHDRLKLQTVKIGNGKSLYIRDEATQSLRAMPFDDAFTPESEAGIPSISVVLDAVQTFKEQSQPETGNDTPSAEQPEDAAYTDCELKLIRRSEGSVYYVKFTVAELGISEEYYVSCDYGVVLSAKTFKDGQPIYSWEVLTLSIEEKNWQDDKFYSLS